MYVETQINVFDTYVKSVLCYGAEIWGFHKGPDVERVHINFCKRILGVRKNTCNSAVYYELGRIPLDIYRKRRILKYWLKLRKSNNCILSACYQDMVENKDPWVMSKINEMYTLGLADLFHSNQKDSILLDITYNRMCDIFKQKAISDICKSPKCMLYKHLVDYFCLQGYLKKPIHVKYRKAISCLRLSAHNLKIETGRYENLIRSDRKCVLCNLNDIEDEFHFLFICPVFHDLRNKFIKHYYSRRPSVFKLIQLFCSTNTKDVNQLGKYIYHANKLRMECLNQLAK